MDTNDIATLHRIATIITRTTSIFVSSHVSEWDFASLFGAATPSCNLNPNAEGERERRLLKVRATSQTGKQLHPALESRQSPA